MLRLLALIYGKIVDLRNSLYDRGFFDTFDLRARTISIGNITAGGTGKTPLVAHVAEVLAARGETVCILTRGYKRKNEKQRVLVCDLEKILADHSTAGDEPFELAQKLFGKAIVIADADRVSAAEWAKRKFGVTAFVLDDGFQHRRARRDVDIVCIDATDPFGGGKMLPAARLRERVANLRRADAIVITRSDLARDISNLRSQISDLVSGPKIFAAKNKISGIVSLNESPARPQSPGRKETEAFQGRKAFAFCGLGNPQNFFDMLGRDGIDVVGTESFRDHHIYTAEDIANVEARARQADAKILLTTAKDAVKLTGLRFEIDCLVAEIDLEIDGPARFDALL